MKLWVIILLIIIIGNSCTGSQSGKSSQSAGDTTRNIYKKPASGFIDTLHISANAAVFFEADSTQLQKIKQAMSYMNYENDTHDCFYQMRNARNVIHQSWKSLQIVEAKQVRYIHFINAPEYDTLIDLDNYPQMCGILLYKGGQQPLLIDMMNVETELHFYFQQVK